MLALALALAAALAGPARAQTRPIVPPEVPLGGAAVSGGDVSRLKAFIDDFHKDLIVTRPDLFKAKLTKAADSDFNFYRAFPQLQYAELKRGPHAEKLAQSVSGRVAGDAHPENIELAQWEGRRVAQVNDFDDSGIAPVAVDIVRAIGGAWFLKDGGAADRRALIEAAREGYRDSLGLSFAKWADGLRDEKAVSEAKSRDRDWLHHAGTPLEDVALAGELATFAGIDPSAWKPFDRAGAGLSSIGVRRYMFASSRRADAHELKQLRGSALEYFTGKPQPESDGKRVGDGFHKLRRVDAELTTFRFDGSDWATRRREGKIVELSADHPKSAARVIGGMLAQMHLSQGLAPERLNEALAAASIEVVEESAKAMAELRHALAKLLKDGAWG